RGIATSLAQAVLSRGLGEARSRPAIRTTQLSRRRLTWREHPVNHVANRIILPRAFVNLLKRVVIALEEYVECVCASLHRERLVTSNVIMYVLCRVNKATEYGKQSAGQTLGTMEALVITELHEPPYIIVTQISLPHNWAERFLICRAK